MRFITLIFFALLPVSAMAGEPVSNLAQAFGEGTVTVEDIDALYEYVDGSAVGNSCKAEAKDGSDSCSITCVTWENAVCRSTRTAASCACVPASKPPKDVDALR